MKIFLITISSILLLFTGCSSTYTIKDYSTKDKFYSDFNKFAGNKNLKVTLTNDSSFTAEGNTKISDDTLIILMNMQKDGKIDLAGKNDIFMYLPINKVKEISYKNHWLGIPFGFLGGAIIGAGVGGWISHYDAQHMGDVDLKNEANLIPLAYGITLGPLSGSVAGWFLGWDYTYQFNP